MKIFYLHPLSFTETGCAIDSCEAVKDVKAKNSKLYGEDEENFVFLRPIKR
jgi:hypothetical protein